MSILSSNRDPRSRRTCRATCGLRRRSISCVNPSSSKYGRCFRHCWSVRRLAGEPARAARTFPSLLWRCAPPKTRRAIRSFPQHRHGLADRRTWRWCRGRAPATIHLAADAHSMRWRGAQISSAWMRAALLPLRVRTLEGRLYGRPPSPSYVSHIYLFQVASSQASLSPFYISPPFHLIPSCYGPLLKTHDRSASALRPNFA